MTAVIIGHAEMRLWKLASVNCVLVDSSIWHKIRGTNAFRRLLCPHIVQMRAASAEQTPAGKSVYG